MTGFWGRLGHRPLRLGLTIALAASALDSPAGLVTVAQTAVFASLQAPRQPIWVGGGAMPTRGWIEFCSRLPEECRVDTRESSSVTLTYEAWNAIVAVNQRVNATVKAVPDREHWGVSDRWDYPDDGSGDCEDIQLLKRRLLVEAGFPRRALRMTVVFDDEGEGHAVLMVLTDRGEIILDNKRNSVLPWNETRYTYIKREGSDGPGWESLVGRLSPVTGDISAELKEKTLSSAPATSSSGDARDTGWDDSPRN